MCMCFSLAPWQVLWRGLTWLNDGKEGAADVVHSITRCLRLLTRWPDFIAGALGG